MYSHSLNLDDLGKVVQVEALLHRQLVHLLLELLFCGLAQTGGAGGGAKRG